MNTRTDHARVKDPRVDRARSPRTQLSSSYVRSRYVQHVPISIIPLALQRNLTLPHDAVCSLIDTRHMRRQPHSPSRSL